MVSPTQRLAGMAKHVAPDWSPDRERAVRARLDRAIVQRKRRQVVATAATALVLVAVALLFWNRMVESGGRSPAGVAQTGAAAPLLHFEDGSTITAASDGARVEPIAVGPELVATRLSAGAARFSVTPNPRRLFRVTARDVTVTVLGTIFTVAVEPSDVRVRVERGRVRVAWPAGEHDVAVGEEFVVPSTTETAAAPSPAGRHPSNAGASGEATEGVATTAESGASDSNHEATAESAPGAAAVAEKAPPESTVAPRHVIEKAAPPPHRVSWRALAEDGDYATAFAHMTREGPNAVQDEPGDLLLSADVARLSGHPDKAVAPLSQVVTMHAGDSRAPLAAFTLGRTLLDQLGRPREAAQAFAMARKLDPRGALSQDALAREVESWSRAGEATLAHDRATEYVERYPKGRRLAAVRRLGGLE